MTIPALPGAPALGDSPEVFNTKAFAFVAALDDWGTAVNAVAAEVDADATAADADAATATTQAGISTTAAGTATTQAGIATTKAGEAATSANLADASADAANLSAIAADASADAAAASAASIDPATLVYKTGDQTIAGVKTFTSKAVIEGLTVGKGAGSVATNTAVGASALAANTTGSENTAVGVNTLSANTSGAVNTAVGGASLLGNTTGGNNAAVGNATLLNNTTGSFNTAIGRSALLSNTSASNNTAVGYQAGYSNTTGTQGVFLGYQAGYANTGNYNTLLGYQAGVNATSGTLNTFVGNGSGTQVTTGGKNVILGSYNGNQGGLDIRTASNYIVLSDGDGNPRLITDSSGYFFRSASGAFTSGTNCWQLRADRGSIQLSNSGTSADNVAFFYNGNGLVGYIQTNGTATSYVTSSDYRLKNSVAPMIGALAKVAALKPVTYKWNSDNSEGEGFIAHELAEVCPQAVTGEKDAVDADGNPEYQGIDTSFLVATLTAAIQELNAKVDAQAAEIAALKGQA